MAVRVVRVVCSFLVDLCVPPHTLRSTAVFSPYTAVHSTCRPCRFQVNLFQNEMQF